MIIFGQKSNKFFNKEEEIIDNITNNILIKPVVNILIFYEKLD